MTRRWYQLSGNDNNNQAGTATLARRIASIESRLAALERAVQLLQAQPLADRARYSWGKSGEPYYHQQGDVMGSLERFAPWVSTTARIAGDLTSSDTVRRTFGEAVLLGVSCTVLGAGAAWWWELPWYASPVVGVAGFSVSVAFLVLLNRTELHRLVSAQQNKGKRRQELRLQIDRPDNAIEFLYFNSNVNREQLREFARAVLGGASLAVHKWTGQGALFTRGQFDDLMTELERMGYARPGSGNVPRTLTAKGRALLRGLLDD